MIGQRVLILLGALLLASSIPAAAQTELEVPAMAAGTTGGSELAQAAWVQIEMIVFRQLDTTSAGDERWPDRPNLFYPEPLRRLDEPVTGKEATLADSNPSLTSEPPAFRQLDATQRVLEREAVRIGASPAYRLLTYRAWRQPAADATTTHLLITGGATHGEHHELEGSVTIRNIDAPEALLNLWLNDFVTSTTGAEAQIGVELPAIPPPPVIEWSEPVDNDGAMTEGGQEAPATPSATSPEPEGSSGEPVRATRSVVLRTARRLAPGELHYIDHPLFGVLITATPLNLPSQPGSTPVDSAIPAATTGER